MKQKKLLLQILGLFFLIGTVNISYAVEARQNLFPGLVSALNVVHVAAVAYGDSNVTLSGTQTIDSAVLVVGNRVLLNNQTDQTENGLWVVQSGAWTRPTDFSTGNLAGVADVLITGGNNYNSTSWVCVMPSATIDIDNILFAQFATYNRTTGANVGAGTGDIFRDKTGNVINFRTITRDTYLAAATVGDVVTLTTDATASNTPSTLVARDSSGDFSAHNLTTNMVTLTGTVTASTDATTKAYVDSAIVGGTLVGDVTGTIGNNSVSYVGGLSGVTQTQIINGVNAANLATNANTGNRIVLRDGSGNFSAGTISANLTGTVTGSLIGNASTATTAGSATNFTGSLIGDVTGTQGATAVNAVGGQTATNVANATITVAAATNDNTASTIVKRDGSGNFSAGTITAALTGTVTGSLVGNASTATSATTATTATNFSGSLSGDVTGIQSATVVSAVGGQAATAVATAATSVAAATPNNTASVLVLRDAAKNFATNMVTLNGTVLNPTDATTKAYVDAAVSSGFTVHPAALVYSASSITLSGLQTIDGVSLSADNRVLLNGQSTTSQNGLWVVQSGAWTRPTDFSAGTTAGSAYVLIQSGTTYAGTGWVCDTPAAIIGTDPISFSQFSVAGTTTAANVGSGAGQIFRDKTGNTLNLKTVAAGTHITVTNNSNDITLATDGVSTNTASTLVARDGSNNFSAGTVTASLTGAASLNVLKTGDTMTGNLNLAAQSATRWQDLSDSNYVGLRAPSAGVGTSYTLDLPGSAPAVNQFLQAATTSTLGWTDIGGTSAVSKIYYVTKNGNDTTGNGSFSAPYLTISKAVSIANPLTSASNPITISIGAGVFAEDNSGGAIGITNDGLSLVGSSILGTVIQPNTFSNDLFNCTTPNVEFRDLTLSASAGSSTASAITVNTSTAGIGRFQSIAVQQFQTAFNLSSTVGVPILRFNNVQPRANGTAFSVTNIHVVLQSSIVLGVLSDLSTPANTGMSLSGSSTTVEVFGTLFRALSTGIAVTNGANLYQASNNFELNNNAIVATANGNVTADGCNFLYNNAGAINVSAAGSGTVVNIIGCDFMCSDTSNVNRGIAVQVTTGSTVNINSSSVNNALVGLQCGTSGDTSSTILNANGGVYLNGCTTDLNQVGTSVCHFISGTLDITKTLFANSTNVSLACFDRSHNDILSVGNMVDSEHAIYQVLNGQATLPTLVYEPSYYGNKGTVYKDGTSDPTFNGTLAAGNNASYYVITGDNTKTAGLNLISDTANIGTSDNVRGWNINKTGTTAGLGFTYSNNDTSGQAARGANTVMNLNGFDNQVEFPTAANTPLPTNTVAKLVWAGDTNLYRSASNQLKTDGNVIVGGLTASRAIATDGSDQLVSSATTATELGYVHGVTSAIQTQLDSKLPLAGGTLTGPLTTQNLIVAATYILCNQSMVRVTPTTGTTVTIANTTSILLIQPAGNLNALTLQFPNTGLTNGQILTISCTANINTITYTNATVNSTATAFTNTLRNAAYIYNLAQTQWYRVS